MEASNIADTATGNARPKGWRAYTDDIIHEHYDDTPHSVPDPECTEFDNVIDNIITDVMLRLAEAGDFREFMDENRARKRRNEQRLSRETYYYPLIENHAEQVLEALWNQSREAIDGVLNILFVPDPEPFQPTANDGGEDGNANQCSEPDELSLDFPPENAGPLGSFLSTDPPDENAPPHLRVTGPGRTPQRPRSYRARGKTVVLAMGAIGAALLVSLGLIVVTMPKPQQQPTPLKKKVEDPPAQNVDYYRRIGTKP